MSSSKRNFGIVAAIIAGIFVLFGGFLIWSRSVIKESTDFAAYDANAYIAADEQNGGNDQGGSMNLNDRDPLFDEIAQYIVASDTASTSSLQRHYNIGYNRAGRIMDQMEAAGIVGPAQGGKPRKVLIDATQLQSMLAQKLF